MRRLWHHPIGHLLLLLVVGAALAFPYLGTPGLWDDDEGVNAECAREMIEAGTWVVPTFNWDLRTAKPIFLYWLLRLSYAAFGITEFAARLPSAIAFIITGLLVYDLARKMFDKWVGLLAGVIALTSLELVKLGRGCTTDSLLTLFTTLYFWALWRGTQNGGRSWFVPCAVASALATLTKGPLPGLAMFFGIAGAWWIWNRDLRRVWDRRLIWACLAWGAIAIPWYALVAAETHGEWPNEFFKVENLKRSVEARENHGGPFFYYAVVVCLMFVPWSGYLGIVLWQTWKWSRRAGSVSDQSSFDSPVAHAPGSPTAYRLLLLWVLAYFAAFSIIATKLPHYIAPAYPALAILTAVALVRWMRREVEWPKRAATFGAVVLLITGIALTVALIIGGMGDRFGLPPQKMRFFPGLENWAWIGLLPIAGGIAMIRFLRKDRRKEIVLSLAISTILFVGFAAAFPPLRIDERKAAKELVAASGARQLDREIRLASFDYSQPSLTFYAARKVERLKEVKEVDDLLGGELPAFLFVRRNLWEADLAPVLKAKYRIAADRYDYTRNADVLVITNR